MKKTSLYIFIAILLVGLYSTPVSAGTGVYTGSAGNYDYYEHWDNSTVIASSDNGSYSSNNAGSNDQKYAKKNTTTAKKKAKKNNADLEDLYEEFHKFWYVKDSAHLQDRFEEFLATKGLDPDDIKNYDDFIEAWTENYDEDLDFDDLYDIYDLGLSDTNGPDDYDVLLDDDIDDLYDDYLDDYINEEDYTEYGEYFDEVYYD